MNPSIQPSPIHPVHLQKKKKVDSEERNEGITKQTNPCFAQTNQDNKISFYACEQCGGVSRFPQHQERRVSSRNSLVTVTLYGETPIDRILLS
jgi:hypothetical protein